MKMNEIDCNNHRVLVIRVGCHSTTDDYYFNDILRILRCQSLAVTIVTDKVFDKPKETRFPQYISKRIGIGSWVPETFGGRYRLAFYVLRTIFTTLYAIRRRSELQPTIIIVDACCVAIPMLKTNCCCPVISMTYFQELLSNETLPITRNFCPFENLCLKFADEIILPSETSMLRYHLRTGTPKEHLTVLYPAVHGNMTLGKRYRPIVHKSPNRRKIVVVIGPWEEKSNFHALFFFLSKFINDHYGLYRKKFRFFILAYMDLLNPRQRAYRDEVLRKYKYLPHLVKDMIRIKTNPNNNSRWAHIRNADIICSLTLHDEFNWSILEGLYYGVAICCTKTPFSAEVFVPELNGLYFDPDNNGETKKDDCKQCLDAMLCVMDGSKYSSYNANVYERSFSFDTRMKVLKQLLDKYPQLD